MSSVQWRGNNVVTRDKAIVLTGIFLVNNVKKQELRLQQDFQAFLEAESNYKMTLDEVSFILGRNGVTLVDLGQDFDSNTTATDFKTFIQELVALPKQLIANLADVLFGFFKSRLEVEDAANQNSAVKAVTKKAKEPNKDLVSLFASAEKKFKEKAHTMVENVKEEVSASPSKEARVCISQEKTEEKEESAVKLLKEELLKHQRGKRELEEKLQKLGEEKKLELKEAEAFKQNLKSTNDKLEKQLAETVKEKEQRMFVEKKFIESLSLLLEGGDLVDEEFDADQTQIVEKVKEIMQGSTRDGVCTTGEVEKSSSSAGSSSESVESNTGCSDAVKDEVLSVLLKYYCISIDVLLSLVQGELVKIRLFHESIQAGSLPHRLFTIPGTNLLPLSALQVAHVDPVESSYRVKLDA